MTASTLSEKQPPGRAARIGFWLGPLWLLMTLVLPAPAGMTEAAWACAGLALLLATWWATEAIPIPATSLLPIILIPALGIGGLGSVTSNYGNPVIFLFLGGFLLGIGMQRWNLHQRIALRVLLVVGQKPRQQIAGFMIATGFLSMWVSNTATAIMMLPIGISVISLLKSDDEAEIKRYATALLLAIAYAASIGGIATLIGTPPNALLAGYMADTHDFHIGFAQWMIVGLPVSIVMMIAAWGWLTRGGFNLKTSDDSINVVRDELEKLGPMSQAERRVGTVFLLAAMAWILRPMLNSMGIDWLSDTSIAIIAGVALFIIPSGTERHTQLMSWEDAKDLPWGILLLFGGGLALAGAVTSSQLAEWIAAQLVIFGMLPAILLVGVVVLVIIFLTEITSNTATAAAFLPLIGAMAISMGIDPILLAAPAAIAASCAFMMPVATPPNAIVFATGHMKIQSMIRAGLFLNIIGAFVVTLLTGWLIRIAWGG
ncbi:MAG: DASS family sodium-coupled anion symporter [Halomonadaceae bacterium]|nr:DASS family sodium-coupled anion symporter [Halomonadaceae bacterium]